MGIKDFFKKAWGGIKKAGRWVGDKIQSGVKLVGRIAQPILGGLSMLPGTIGTIGRVGSGIIGGINGVINQLPDGQMKDKMKEWSDTGQEKLKIGVEKGIEYADRANKIIGAGRDAVNQIKPAVYNPPVSHIIPTVIKMPMS